MTYNILSITKNVTEFICEWNIYVFIKCDFVKPLFDLLLEKMKVNNDFFCIFDRNF